MSEITKKKIFSIHLEVFEDFMDQAEKAYMDSNIVGLDVVMTEFAKWLRALDEELKCFPTE